MEETTVKIIDAATLESIRSKGMKKLFPDVPKISVGMGTCGIGNGAKADVEAKVASLGENVITVFKLRSSLDITANDFLHTFKGAFFRKLYLADGAVYCVNFDSSHRYLLRV